MENNDLYSCVNWIRDFRAEGKDKIRMLRFECVWVDDTVNEMCISVTQS